MNQKFVFEAIGTHWEIDLLIPVEKKQELLQKIKSRIGEFDKNYSRFRKDSLVYKIFQTPGTYRMPSDFAPLFEVYRELNKKTNGLFTPLIGSVLRDAGYDEEYSLQKRQMTLPSLLSETIQFKENALTVKTPWMMDFGAGGKGYIIDIIGMLLEENEVTEYCIDAGGDILKKGSPLTIGLENPTDTTQVIGSVVVKDSSICGSAGNRRAWGQFHHIINPETLQSPTEILAVWVTSKTALIADAISTALFLDPRPEVSETFPCEYLIMYKDSSVIKSKGFQADLFYSDANLV